jgi:hypothetical protein
MARLVSPVRPVFKASQEFPDCPDRTNKARPDWLAIAEWMDVRAIPDLRALPD